MRTRHLLAGALLTCLPAAAFAQDAPPPTPALPVPVQPARPKEPTPPSADSIRQQEELDRQVKALNDIHLGIQFTQEKGPYLGVSASPAGPALQKQLKLPAGMGLVVDFVEDDSPAKKAGLAQFDVLQKVNDQLLVNPEQLQVLIRSFKPDETIKLTLLREGKPQTLDAKLAERDVGPMWRDLEAARRQIAVVRPRLDVKPGWTEDPFNGRMQILLDQPAGPEVVQWEDDEHHMELLRPEKGDPILTVTRRGPKPGTVYKGPIRTDKQRAALPPEVRKKLESIQEKLADFEVDKNDSKEEPELIITRRDGERRIQLRDKKRKVMFEAPIETPEQRDALPEDVKRRLLEMVPDAPTEPKATPAPTPRR